MTPRPGSTWRSHLAQTVLLLAFWLALSDQRDPLFVGLGLASAVLVTVLTRPIIATVLAEPGSVATSRTRRALAAIAFMGWLFGRIIAASVQVAYFALHPGLPFEPRFVRFRTTMRRPLSRVALGVSITLVPGTVTVHVEGDEYLVHALLPSSADDLTSARMQNLIGRVLGEDPEDPPEIRWEPVEGPAP